MSHDPSRPATRRPARASLPAGVVALGVVSLLMDTSSEMIHSLLPVFLVTVLGAGAMSVGVIEGIAEATASISKVFSGALSDRVGRRTPLILAGYGLAALTKPFFAIAGSVGMVLGARFADRVGKGVRGAPRDALIADITPAASVGAAFGLRQSMDTVGAFLGPALAIALMWASGDDFRLVFWIATIPALLAVAVIVRYVRDPERRDPPHAAGDAPRRVPLRCADLSRLGPSYWRVVAFAGVLTLARFSEAFLLLRAQEQGLADRYVPVVLIAMNVAYAASAYPLGVLSDRVGRRRVVAAGIALLVVADVILAVAGGAGGVALVLAGAAVWGVHMGATQGAFSALVADRAPGALRGTAFGMLNLVMGASLLAASILAGALWAWAGPAWTFTAGAGVAAVALAMVTAPRVLRAG